MKKFIFLAHCYAWLNFALPPIATAQNLDTYPNYVVIGAFELQKNAVQFTEDANKHNFPARFEMNPNRSLYYVYVLTTTDRENALAEALKLRTDTKYFDTWVYSGVLGKFQATNSGTQGQDINPSTGQRFVSVNAEQNAVSSGENHGVPENKGKDHFQAGSVAAENLLADNRNTKETPGQPLATRDGVWAKAENKNEGSISKAGNTGMTDSPAVVSVGNTGAQAEPSLNFPEKASTTPLTPEEVAGKNFYFQLFRADNNRIVEGEIDAIDFEKSRKIATYPANKSVKVLMPSGKSGQISFVCQVFGYRKLQIEFDPAHPQEGLYLDEAGNLVVPFELVRLQKGDIAIMYNVFFFKDAAVMRPESRYEVNNLLELLNENPAFKIRIHGHTNGNASGKIILMDKSDNFYSLSNTSQGFGSAKKLSEDRALAIKHYLEKSGISEDRMQVKAWGGKKPIHDKNSARAQENVRVEIEIL